MVGPTASGKSALALALARTLGDVEIVSVDSMQVYQGLDIGTAKPTRAERSEVVHHLVDVVEPTEEWSVAEFQAAARAAVAEVEARGRRALLVGGTGLYVQAVVDDLRFPARDRELRTRLEARVADAAGLAAAYAEVCRRDPRAAARIDPGNARRIVRVLEVLELTGRPFSEAGEGVLRGGPTVFPVRCFGVWLPRRELACRIDERIAAMFAGGLLDEAAALVAPGAPPLSRTAAQAIGYREVLALLAGDLPSIDAARAEIARRTRAFARRQRMWFRRDPRITWFGTSRNPDLLLPALLECCR